MIYEKDNLELMATMESETIDLIYCDILYGTGKDFMDYKDLYPMKEIIYKHYEPRIKEMHRILKNTGSIYLQMDYRIVHWVRCILDDAFGYGNFRNEIIWHYKSMSNTKRFFPRKHDNILFYTKSDKYIFNHDDDSVRIPYSEATLKRSRTKAGFNNDKPNYLKSDTYLIEDVWNDISFLKNNVIYNTQKPKTLLERIIKVGTNEGDIVADFFCGSGTTLVVAKELDRQYIGCDINPKAIEIANNRLNKIS